MPVTLVIPVKDEAKDIDELLDSIISQSRAPDEIIIVDGGSVDATKDIVKSYAQNGLALRFIEAGSAYPGEGRNIGTSLASHDLIAYTDSGIVLGRKWLEGLLEVIGKDSSIDVVYGNYEPLSGSFFRECAAIAYIAHPEIVGGVKMRHHFIASSLIKKRAWEKVGGFPRLYRAAEDLIFMEQLEKNGLKVAYAPEAVVFWHIPGNLWELLVKYTDYSSCNFFAGRWRHWHSAILRIYALVLFFVFLSIRHNLWWLTAICTLIACRTLKRFCLNEKLKELFGIKGLARFLLVTLIIVTLDLAALLGIFKILPRILCHRDIVKE